MPNPLRKPAGKPPAGPGNLAVRPRRLRRTDALRSLVREIHLSPDDFIYPLFIAEGNGAREPVKSMPGIFRETEKTFPPALKKAEDAGVKAVMLFGIPKHKDAIGSDSLKPTGLLARMIRQAKETCPDLIVMADLCFCKYTEHGHCGVLDERGDVDNDMTLENLAVQALVAAKAGADLLAPSGMMDGTISTLRSALDSEGYTHIPLMAYSTKFASAFYGPFRDAAACSLGKGNRRTYQMDPANGREAVRESLLDEAQGADILMVKPGMPYLDVLANIRKETRLPLAVYQVSGEYAMIKHAAAAGALDAEAVMLESLIAFKRAGADLILSYFAPDVVSLLGK